jgi:hypothetical protein
MAFELSAKFEEDQDDSLAFCESIDTVTKLTPVSKIT